MAAARPPLAALKQQRGARCTRKHSIETEVSSNNANSPCKERECAIYRAAGALSQTAMSDNM